MPRIRVGDIEMFYVEAGAGEPLVLVMGFGGDHLAWGFQMAPFAERYRVLAFDNRGVGQTDQPDVPYTTAGMAKDVVGLMDAVGIDRAHVLGVSLGGMIAQELALGHPDRVLSLQLHGTCARPDAYLKALVAAWRDIRTTLSREAAMRAIALWLFAPVTYAERPAFIEALIQNALATPYPQSVTGFLRQGDAVLRHDALDRVSSLACPTLVTVAEEDILVPPRFARQLEERIPGAEFRTVDGAAHAYFWERPDVVNALCLEFLAGQRRR